MDKIFFGQKLSDTPKGILQDIFYLAAVLPSIHMGVFSDDGSHALSRDVTAVAVHSITILVTSLHFYKKSLLTHHL